MKTIRSLIYGEILIAVGFVTLGFLALFFFFDFVDELGALGQAGYGLKHALSYVLLLVPSHLYELLPISVLIGTIFVMARFAQTSEYTILRTSGLGPWRALKTLLVLGLGFVLLTYAVGDYLAPASNRTAQLLKAEFRGGGVTLGQTGAWLKERQTYSSFAANVGQLTTDGEMRNVRIWEFDGQGLLLSITHAQTGRFATDDSWMLENAQRSEFSREQASSPPGGKPGNGQSGVADKPTMHVERQILPSYRWPTEISAEMVSVALLKPDRMSVPDLFGYIRHLNANEQSAQRYEIEFWKKVFYPLSCLVMVVLALPFAYLHFRSSPITTYVFIGVMIGISFFLLNNVFGYIGNLNNWQPWIAAGAPGMIYTLLSLGAFGWLVLRR
jgi:lipopolysaccharide export system permease protein